MAEIAHSLYDVLDREEWRSIQTLMRLSGRVSNGGPQYTAIMQVMVARGLAERQEFPSSGRNFIKYRRVSAVFYNFMEDKRFYYREWGELPMVLKQQALDRYEGQQEWLGNEDWLYPVTRGRVTRLAKADRVLRLTFNEAEKRREAWRARLASGLAPL